MVASEEIEISIAYIHIENDICYITIKKDAEIDVDQVREGIKARLKIQKGKSMLVLADIKGLEMITREARAYAAGNDELLNLNKAMAIVSGSLATKLLANFFIKFNKPSSPTKMFQSKEKALEWLETFR